MEAVDPGFEDPLEISIGLWFAGAHSVWNGLTDAQREQTDPDFAAEALMGERLDQRTVQDLTMRRGLLGSHMRQFMQRYDALLTPAVAIPAFDARPAGQQQWTDDAMLGWTPFSCPFNLTQQPAISVPCGLTQAGLPIGLQIVGRMFDDAMVLRVARAYESVHPVLRPVLANLESR